MNDLYFQSLSNTLKINLKKEIKNDLKSPYNSKMTKK